MKKTILFILVSLLIVGIIYWLYDSYNFSTLENPEWHEYIPKENCSYTFINADKVKELILTEYFSSPSEMKSLYHKMDTMSGITELPIEAVAILLNNGLSIPSKIVLAELEIENEHLFYTVISQKDSARLLQFLRKENSTYSELSSGIHLNPIDKIGIAFLDKVIIVLTSKSIDEDQISQAVNIINTAKFEKQHIKNPDIKELFFTEFSGSSDFIENLNLPAELRASISYVHKKGESSFIIKRTDSLVQHPSIINAIDPLLNSSHGILYLGLDFNNTHYPLQKILLEKEVQFLDGKLKVLQTSTAELNAVWDGQVEFTLTEKDTILEQFITYEYDDNFEKKEKTTTQKKPVSSYHLMLGNSNNLDKYFRTKSWVHKEKNTEVFIAVDGHTNYSYSKKFVQLKSSKIKSSTEINNSNFIFRADIPAICNNYPTLSKHFSGEILKNELSKVSILTKDIYSIEIKLDYLDNEKNGLVSFIVLINALQKDYIDKQSKNDASI